MTVFTVDTDAMHAAHASTRATIERLRAESSTLMAQLRQLQSSWVGTASNAFQGCAEQWQGAQLHVEQVLDGIGTSLGSVATQYADADQYSASMFR
ncbi:MULTISPECIES: WXG100 family type VII secretion target [Microbacterium]|uniref:ESAT-6-like protein n=1 Tax=Microbacterium sufflavum TaxID=2851649 RepID=A0ABY4IA40_9MICO|nr:MULTISPECIES: WXG100 family type VII secretion target [Microbacterium]MPS75382.1 WXG100 family type VII secretion target [Microbacterium sp.]UPL09618.1 WXG100 family type VII secretion target [Microbacterium sufflavum]